MYIIKRFELGMQGTNCYVISDRDKNCVIVDCNGDGKTLSKYIDENGLKLAKILLTHGHSDHIGAVEFIRRRYGCNVCVGEIETKLLKDPNINLSAFFGIKSSIDADELLKDGDVFTVGEMTFKVISTPGHTSGSICYILDNNIMSGDTLFAGSCGRTDFPTGDWAEIEKSLKRLKNLEGDYNVYPGHGPSTTLEYERKTNPFMK